MDSHDSNDWSWRGMLWLFFFTSMVESLGMSHVFAFLPQYLSALHTTHISTWIGVLSALTFVVGLPLVPMWGTWANRYGGKWIIIRSAIVEALVFVLFAISHQLWTTVVAMSLVGFQLGNTGIMLSSLRERAPRHQIGYVISVFSVSSAVGAAIGPLFGGWVVGNTPLGLHGLFWIDAGLSLLTAVSLAVGYREAPVRRDLNRDVKGWQVAWTSVKVTFSLPVSWLIFGVYTLFMLGRQIVNPYLPVAILKGHAQLADPALVVGLLLGFTALIGACMAVVAGKIGDRVGFVRVLRVAFVMNAVVVPLLALSTSYGLMTLWLAVYSGATSIAGAMVFALMSVVMPETHRTTALNLVYLPLYVGGMIGPFLSAVLSPFGLLVQFALASVCFLAAIGVSVKLFAIME